MSASGKKVAIIPARGGSKRIPRKNIKPFLGLPIISYSIKAALASKLFDEVMVSTDDNEIAQVALQYGAKVPFMRSPSAADDFATTADVIGEVLSEYEKQKIFFDYACCIYPTAPFITASTLRKAWEKLLEHNASSVFPMVKFSYPIWRSLKQENGAVAFNFPEFQNFRSQDLPEAYHDAGQLYFFNVSSFQESKTLFFSNSIGVEVSELECQDIDSETDWQLAEMKYQLVKNSM